MISPSVVGCKFKFEIIGKAFGCPVVLSVQNIVSRSCHVRPKPVLLAGASLPRATTMPRGISRSAASIPENIVFRPTRVDNPIHTVYFFFLPGR